MIREGSNGWTCTATLEMPEGGFETPQAERLARQVGSSGSQSASPNPSLREESTVSSSYSSTWSDSSATGREGVDDNDDEEEDDEEESLAFQLKQSLKTALIADVDQLDWPRLCKLCTPDDLRDVDGEEEQQQTAMTFNSGGHVFFAFFRPRGSSNPLEPSLAYGDRGGGKEKQEVLVESEEPGGSLQEALISGPDTEDALADLARGKGPHAVDRANTPPRQESGGGTSEAGTDAEATGPLAVCVIKFMEKVPETQAEYCANSIASTLGINIPRCEILRRPNVTPEQSGLESEEGAEIEEYALEEEEANWRDMSLAAQDLMSRSHPNSLEAMRAGILSELLEVREVPLRPLNFLPSPVCLLVRLFVLCSENDCLIHTECPSFIRFILALGEQMLPRLRVHPRSTELGPG